MITLIIAKYVLVLYISLAVVGGFALGVWIQRLFVWYPFGLNPLTGSESMIGKQAIVTLVKPNYMEVRFDSQIWKARLIGSSKVEQGDSVEIKDVFSNTLMVEHVVKTEGRS